jgi:hypothetical protein
MDEAAKVSKLDKLRALVSSPPQDDPLIPLPTFVFLQILSYVNLNCLCTTMLVNKLWCLTIAQDNLTWKIQCDRLWASKVYVPQTFRILSKGPKGFSDWKADERARLNSKGVKGMTQALLKMEVNRNQIAGCFEKKEFVDLLFNTTMDRDSKPGLPSITSKSQTAPFHPTVLSADVEEFGCLARLALLYSIMDSRRHAITEAEMCAQPWHIRVREDGPFAQVIGLDPWWQGKGNGTVQFHGVDQQPKEEGDERKMVWDWPLDDKGE